MMQSRPMKLISSAILCSVLISVSSLAGGTQDQRIKRIPFRQNAIVTMDVSGTTITQIVFNKQERILEVMGLKKCLWSHVDGHHATLFIRPICPELSSNLTVLTNQHTYYFQLNNQDHLRRTSEPVVTAQYAIQFTYPAKPTKHVQSNKKSSRHTLPDPDSTHPNRRYSFHGAPQLQPMQAYDNGTFTTLCLWPNQPIPAIFSVDNAQGKESVVNFRREGNCLIIDRIAPQFTLRNGKNSVASLFNDHYIEQLARRR